MARMNNNRSSDNNGAEIEVLYIKARNINSDLSGVAQAIASAFRPAPLPVTGNGSARQLDGKDRKSPDNQTSMDFNENSEVLEGEVTEEMPKKERTARERKAFKGEIDDTISWDGNGTPFVDYVKQKNPQDTIKKYLVISAWFKRHGNKDSVNSNLIYNAYRKMGWGGLTDMNQPFQNGAKSDRGYFKKDAKEGSGFYTITNIGLDVVEKIGSEKTGGDS